MKKSIVVIGAGFGGLTAAALLSQAGHNVTVLEKEDWIGGKSRRLTLSGQTIDSGPSLLTFPGVWQEILKKYRQLGGATEFEPELLRLAEVGRYYFRNEQIDLPIPREHRWFEQWERFVDEHSSLAKPIEILLTSHPLSARNLSALWALLRTYGIKLNTRNYLLAQKWMTEGFRELIAIHTLNAGVAPEKTLPIFASVTAVMADQGIMVPKGGINEIPQYLAKLAEKAGCKLIFKSEVISIEKGRVVTENGELTCDLVVSAIDDAKTRELLTGKKESIPKSRSCSGVAIYAVLDEELPVTTVTHSVVMPDNPKELYEKLNGNIQPNQTMAFVNYYRPGDIYENSKPTIAILLTAAADGSSADLSTPWVSKELERISEIMGFEERLDKRFVDYKILDPGYFETIGGQLGAIYGRRNPLWRSGPFHSPSYRSLLRPWLYRVGSSVHPGGGMPAVMGGAMNSIGKLL